MSYVYVSKKMSVLCTATQILSYFESSTKIRVNTRCQALCVVWPLFRVWFFGIMIQKLPFCLIIVLFSHLQVVISKSDLHARTSLNISPNGSTFLWLPQDEYSGPSFFECVHFLFRHVKHLRITRKPLGLFHGRWPNTVRKSLRYLSGMLISRDSGTVKWVFTLRTLCLDFDVLTTAIQQKRML